MKTKKYPLKHLGGLALFIAVILTAAAFNVKDQVESGFNKLTFNALDAEKPPSDMLLYDVNGNREGGAPVAVKIVDHEGKKIGTAVLMQQKNGVEARISVSGLSPGKHGFHIHEKAFSGSDFQTAGGHFNPTAEQHGFHNPQGFHKGDLPNLEVKRDGTAEMSVLLEGVTLEQGQPHSLIGRSMIIHAEEDDYVTDPAGNSGDRIAGGNI